MAIAVVAGALANKPHQGGEAWVRLNWVLGLRRLGFDVYLIEQIDSATFARAEGGSFQDGPQLAYFKSVTERFGLAERCALLCDGGAQWHGLSLAQVQDLAQAADVLLNISGHLRLEPLLERLRRRVYIDIDPGFTQIWHEQGQGALGLDRHDFHFTIGRNIGKQSCPIPTGGFHWRHIFPPVVLDEWPLVPPASSRPLRFTTIANWRGGFGPLAWRGQTLGLKVHEFRKFMKLPQICPEQFEIALNIHPGDARDREELAAHRWQIVDPGTVSTTPDEIRRYIQGSSAEFSAAQGVYVQTQSGWFSDRTAAYLASGRPALVQDTGLGAVFPAGEGLLLFPDLEQAASGAERIAADYESHCRAARRLAEEHFDSDRVLAELLQEIGLPIPNRA